MKLSQTIEVIAEVKKEAAVKQGARERVEIGVSVYLGKDKITSKHNYQWYTCMAFETPFMELFLNKCPIDTIVKVSGDVKYRISKNKEGDDAIYGTIFVRYAEAVGFSERKIKIGNFRMKQSPIIENNVFEDDITF